MARTTALVRNCISPPLEIASSQLHSAISRLQTRAAAKARTAASLKEADDALFVLTRPTRRSS